MSILCLFLPAFISLFIYIKVIKDNNKLEREDLFYYVLNVFIINIIILVLCYFRGIRSYVFNLIFVIKYLFVSILLAIIMPFILKKLYTNNVKEFFIKLKNNLVDFKSFKSFKSFIKSKSIKKLLLNIIFCLIFISVFIFFDYYIRKSTLVLDDFYFPKGLTPNILSIAYILLFLGLLFLIKNKTIRRIVFSIIFILGFALFVADFCILKVKNSVLNFTYFMYASEGLSFINFVKKDINITFILMILALLVIFVVLIILVGKIEYKKKKRLPFLGLLIVSFLICRYVGIHDLQPYSDDDFNRLLYTGYYYDNYVNPIRSMQVSGLYEFSFRDLYLNLKYMFLSSSDKGNIDKIIAEDDRKLEKNEYTDIFKDKNLIMIMMESIDNVVVNDNTMPTLMKMKKNSLDFSNRYGQFIYKGSTISTEFTSLTGLYDNGLYYHMNTDIFSNSLTNLFNEAGYKTTFIHGNKGVFYNRNNLHKNIGFQNMIFTLDDYPDENYMDDSSIVNNDDIYNFAFPKDERFFSYFVTISAHGPYDEGNYYCSVDEIASQSEKKCLEYGASLTDNFLKILLERLKEDGILDDTVIVLFTDHYAYSYTYEEDDYNIYKKIDDDYLIKNIPFMIYSSGIKGKKIDNLIFGDIDILPTIANMFGLEYNPRMYVGTDLFDKNRRNLVFFVDQTWYDGSIYSDNKNVDVYSSYYKDTSNYVLKKYDLNQMIISTNYYAAKSK